MPPESTTAVVPDSLTTFIFPTARCDFQVRVTDREGNPWFVLADVCRVLEIGNTSDAARRLDDDEKDALDIIDPIGRPQRATIISEAGLYSLILTSRKPEAREFKRWITHTVLPSIRKNGGYVAGQGKLKTGEESPAEFLAQQPRRPSVPLQHPSI